jgi:hypothetical protein
MLIKKLEITGLAGLPSGKTFIHLEKVNIFTGRCTGYHKAVIKALTLLFNGGEIKKEDFAIQEEESGSGEIEITATILFREISTGFPDTMLIPELFHLLQVSDDREVFCTLRFSAALKDDEISIRRNWILPDDLLFDARSMELIKTVPITPEILAGTQEECGRIFFPVSNVSI